MLHNSDNPHSEKLADLVTRTYTSAGHTVIDCTKKRVKISSLKFKLGFPLLFRHVQFHVPSICHYFKLPDIYKISQIQFIDLYTNPRPDSDFQNLVEMCDHVFIFNEIKMADSRSEKVIA